MKKRFLLLFLSGVLIFGIFEAYQYYQYKKKQQEEEAYRASLVDTSDSIPVAYINEKKTIHIYVPPNYTDDTLTRYPVIYMMDGESSYNDLENMAPEWEIDEVINAASANGKQTAIVIGINDAEDRDAEYTPFSNEDNPDSHGDKFAQWVTTDLKNWVDTHYRTQTDPASTTIGGISRSGMMAYYMVMAHSDIFGNALIQSPSMWVDYDRLMAMELSEEQLSDKKIFVSVGGREGGDMVPDASAIFKKFKAKGMTEENLLFEIIPDEGHWHMTWRKSFALGYPFLFE